MWKTMDACHATRSLRYINYPLHEYSLPKCNHSCNCCYCCLSACPTLVQVNHNEWPKLDIIYNRLCICGLWTINCSNYALIRSLCSWGGYWWTFDKLGKFYPKKCHFKCRLEFNGRLMKCACSKSVACMPTIHKLHFFFSISFSLSVFFFIQFQLLFSFTAFNSFIENGKKYYIKKNQ